jgi:hypothetical protein
MRRLKEFLNWPELKRQPPPRIAIVVVVVGLLACAVAALATAGKYSGEYGHLEWVKKLPLEDSKAVAVPGSDKKMQLVEGKIRSTGTNFSGYNLYQVANVLKVDAEAPLKGSRIKCAQSVPQGVEIGHSGGGLRTLYPRSSEGIYSQEVPETLVLKFSSHNSEYSVVEVGDIGNRFTTEAGVKLEWPQYEVGTEHLDYFIAGKNKKVLELPFYAIWRSLSVAPKAAVSCTIETGAGKATVKTEGEMKQVPPPIDEEAEELKEEERDEAGEAEEEATDEAGGEGEG